MSITHFRTAIVYSPGRILHFLLLLAEFAMCRIEKKNIVKKTYHFILFPTSYRLLGNAPKYNVAALVPTSIVYNLTWYWLICITRIRCIHKQICHLTDDLPYIYGKNISHTYVHVLIQQTNEIWKTSYADIISYCPSHFIRYYHFQCFIKRQDSNPTRTYVGHNLQTPHFAG